MQSINEKIKELLKSQNISQRELANRLGCTRQNINDKLNDGNMYGSTIDKILDAIGYEVCFKKKDETAEKQ